MVFVKLSGKCNLSCSQCGNPCFKDEGYMDIDILRKILTFLKERGDRQVILTGGEPSIHPKLLEIISLCKTFGMKVCMTTNGLVFSNKYFLSQALKEGLSLINVSLKAVDAENFLFNTGKDFFEQQRRAIINIVKEKDGCCPIVNIMLTDYFIKNFWKAIDMAVECGVELFTFALPKPVIGDSEIEDNCPSVKNISGFLEDVFETLQRYSINYTFRINLPFCLFSEKVQNIFSDKITFFPKCNMKSGKLIIFDQIGNIIPCNYFPHKLGRIGVDFSTPREYELFLRHLKMKDNYSVVGNSSLKNEKCLNCRYEKRCGGGCPLFHAAWGEQFSRFLSPVKIINI